MWDYICPKCKKEVKQKSHKCVHCGENYGVPLRVPPKVLKDPKALEDYVHQNIFPKVSASQREYLTQWFTEIYSDGFEGDLSGWDYTFGSPTISTDYAHHGEKSLKCTVSGTYVKKIISSYYTIFVRAYVRVEALGAEYSRVDLLRFWNGAQTLSSAGFYIAGGSVTRIFGSYSTTDYYYADATIEASTWYCLELKFVVSSTVGEVKVWLDGDLLVDQTGLNTGTLVVNRVGCGKIYAGSGWGTAYVDCFVAADAYIGEEGGAILKEVADSVGLADAILTDKTLSITESIASLDSLLTHKTLQITDTITILETILRDKIFTVSDSVSLSELITVITGGIIKEVVDAIGLSEQLKIDKSLIIQDTVSILDQIFRHKPNVSITDAIALAEVIAASKLFTITDAVSIADVVYAMKTLSILDQITITDQVSTPTRILQALDAIGLSDTAYVNKTLIITDQIALAEVVEVGKGVAAKTKLFLVIGDLAIQLSG